MADSCEFPLKFALYCRKHQARFKKWGDANYTRKAPPGESVGHVNRGGYKLIPLRDHPNAYKTGYILEHVAVMSEMLKRPLIKGENVHHKNGVKDDNRPDNLELWVTMQPTGQRPIDLVAYAHEILNRYEDLVNQK